ncbi:RluA family pseudouridine synthase [Schleiferilactobacillus perolens]|jgi:23S rRNA pseudouridine1911/1915/1917 synthase|uniref:RluA family pseudouridine synthase n=1 Tax=Schleiferilactobacillus perolens TaxID=100468 RepID=UPI002357F31A|nr:RluA family pseudouridine synthase [Schleiferilactobacillus perolens]MCI2170266.1 RluA family pseudouridine synthase [Schleiferilactobacillus perolens]
MIFKWVVPDDGPESMETFLTHLGLSRSFISRTKFNGGALFVNSHQRNSDYPIHPGDVIRLVAPPERSADNIIPSDLPIHVLYEDQDLLIVNKPPFVASIPSPQHPRDTMANRVKGYLHEIGNESDAVHVVSRLDRDTSGVMLFAKHSLAHSLLDHQIQSKAMIKEYFAVLTGALAPGSGLIDLPIDRAPDSLYARMVKVGGKASLTAYTVDTTTAQASIVSVRLLTGRTHQIRVHFDALGHPLVGDDLYGTTSPLIDRQALHAHVLRLRQPLTGQNITVTAPLPPDLCSLRAMVWRAAEK